MASLLAACGPAAPPAPALRIAELPPLPPEEATSTSPATPAAPVSAGPLARDEALDRVARALAGRDDAPGLAEHARAIDEHLGAYETRLGAALGAWATTELGDGTGATVLYPFSGPDFLTAHRLFPRAARYVLVSRERAGRVGRGAPRGERLAQQRRALEGLLRRGFFLTRDMSRDFPDGVADTLAAQAALEGLRVDAEARTRVSSSGALVDDPDGDSLRLWLRRPGGGEVELDFVSTDLSDPWLRRAAGVSAWLASVAGDRALLKAASHLLQQPGFAVLRDALVARARLVVQDETGVDYAALAPSFDVALYGAFTRVNPLFAGTPQRALARAFRERDDVRPLPFSLGYRKPSGSCLLVARRR
ncbi:MAG: hypothetical protein IT374_16450 [Polyangiaceae bacterium]|nr:hypothetical protein [Polyangiaceae bacterium]